jgi:signal transduction histidine kinase
MVSAAKGFSKRESAGREKFRKGGRTPASKAFTPARSSPAAPKQKSLGPASPSPVAKQKKSRATGNNTAAKPGLDRTAELVQKTWEMSEQARQLDEANFSLRQLSARILHLQDEERRRIASHLHDSTGSWLTALALNLGVLKKEATELGPKAAAVLDDSLHIIREMSDDLRTVSHLLHPPLLDEMGLQSALRWFVEGFSERSKIPVELKIDERLGRLTRECETVIFRIVQEALTNVHRHSGSPRASICVTRDDGELTLEVRDWGRGLRLHSNGASKQSGVGLRGMRERVRQLGGSFELRRNPDGTSVIAKFTDASVCLVTQPSSAA